MRPVDPPDPSPKRTPLGQAWLILKVGVITLFVAWQLFFLAVRNPVDLWDKESHDWATRQSRWGDVVHDFNNHRLASSAEHSPVGPQSTLGRKLKAVEPPWERSYDEVDRWTKNYGRVLGVEQGWSMFTPNLAREGTFLAARIEFKNGQELLIKSENEPRLPEDEDLTAVPDPNAPPSDEASRWPAFKSAVPQPYFRLGAWRLRKFEDNLVYTKPDKLNGMTHASEDDLPLFEAFVRWTVRRWRQRYPDDHREVFQVVLLRRRLYFPEAGLDWRDPYLYHTSTSRVGNFNEDGSLRKP
jgi:hypothetical protein